MKTHYIKIDSEQFVKIAAGELPKFKADVSFLPVMPNDMVILCETVNGTLTGKQLPPFEFVYVKPVKDGEEPYHVIAEAF